MIIELLFTILISPLDMILALLPDLPVLPQNLLTSYNNFLNLIVSNLDLLDLIIPYNTLKLTFPILILIINFDKIYNLTMWLVRKLPWSIQ